MADFLGQSHKVKLICKPFEDAQIPGTFQLAFTSPPYFKKEIYSDEPTQSCHRYPDFESWLRGFWQVTIEKVADCLESGGLFIVNIQDVKIGQQHFPLVTETRQLAQQAGLWLKEMLQIRFSGFGSGLDKFKTEPVMVFKKG